MNEVIEVENEALFTALNWAVIRAIDESPDAVSVRDACHKFDPQGQEEICSEQSELMRKMAKCQINGALTVYMALLFDPVAQSHFRVLQSSLAHEDNRSA